MRTPLFRSYLLGALVLSACAVDTDDSVVETQTPSALGITRFAVQDTSDLTIVTGFDQAGNEVGRLELVHGAFDLSPAYAEDYPGEGRIDGRRVRVAMHGSQRYSFETKGFEPVMHLPAHPTGQQDLAQFLNEPQVKVVLDRWQIGWDVEEVDGELSYTNKVETIINNSAAYYTPSTGTSYGSPRTMGGVAVGANTCGGSGVAPTQAIRANRMRRDSNGVLIGDGSQEWIITQVCNDPTLWFGRKSCSLVNNDSRSRCQPSSTSTAGCSNCGSYEGVAYPLDLTGQSYAMSVDAGTNLRYCYGTTTDVKNLSVTVHTQNSVGGVQLSGVFGASTVQQNLNQFWSTQSVSYPLCLNARVTLQGWSNNGFSISEDFSDISGTPAQGTGTMNANHYFNNNTN